MKEKENYTSSIPHYYAACKPYNLMSIWRINVKRDK